MPKRQQHIVGTGCCKYINLAISVTVSLSTFICLFPTAFAQSAPPPGVTIPPETPDTIERITPQPNESPSPLPQEPPTEPPKPSLETPPTQESPEATFGEESRIPIKKIEVLGSTVLQDKIQKLIEPLEKKGKVTFEELLQLRSNITQVYLDNGYVTSGAFLPNNQDISSGTIKIQVVEGELENIELSGLNRLQRGYVRSRLRRATSKPLNQKRLEEALQLLQLDPLISRVNAELTAGSTPGRNILEVQIQEAQAFHAGVSIDNTQSPSIGSLQGSVFIAHDNVLGFGDRFNAEYGRTEGLNLYDINYTIPINSLNGTIGFRYSNTDSRIIEDPFEELDIKSETQTYSLSVRQPLYRTPTSEFALGLSLDLRRNQTFILDDIPYSFSEGPENGESKVTVIRFSQDWVNRNANRVLAARSQFSLGINAFDATNNDTGTDGQFFSWLGQFQWVQRLSPRTLLLARLNAQLTGDSLLSLEKLSIGGFDTVRGYRQNQLVADNGVAGSLEVRFPPIASYTALQLAPFFDIGTTWNNQAENPAPQTIASLGLGLIWQPSRSLYLRLDYGVPLIDVDNQGDSLQDKGLHFSLRYQAF
ncbi:MULTISPECIES: ShlB/FhaC/HecB family hemolysin secretion/activation protein [Nostocales]|uniref:ShlB/FhaC/HecB family hemolysin secretion/activation protein n=3 Tax=Nostocales TaxID=1161 RepID=A0A8S9TFW8_9CYAN|nr:ShlB/FhaC/HecB family hemolysin secretion/activation protein [Tolypothrix bouteillei]KAF3891215.1 ShlB/FhaC/HecB family hemolysin secretion/activation protein [Tolypothrix bouteillei VB521301]